ncbi:MAG: FKBP-type peptidyl-prolyl cis-trans isomerase, partial [Bacteroidota bacterium]
GQVIPGMEKGLEGKKVGEHVSLTIGPEEGYGHINPQLLGEVPKTMFEGGVPEVGMQFQAQMGEQVQIITVKEIKGDSVVIDGNHALAGQTLHFSIGIAAVRPATDEEKAHGHAHGPDGTDTH